MSSGNIEDPKSPPAETNAQQTSMKDLDNSPKKEEEGTKQPVQPPSNPTISSAPAIATPEKPVKEPKMISLHPDELIKWDKRIKELNGQVKSLTAENTTLKNELATSNKRYD
jgi:hypothetical protein